MYQERVLSARHYTDNLFSFEITRPDGFRFRSGEFTMLGLEQDDGKPLLRAYSIASPSWQEKLEFFSIKVPNGPLTSKLQSIQPGDKIVLGRKSTGTLVLDALTPGKNLYLLSTGTGLAPFASIIRDPETFERYENVILTHTCRTVKELNYGKDLMAATMSDEILQEIIGDKLKHFTSVTREDYPFKGRITNLIENGTLAEAIGLPDLNPETDRVMVCGSMGMLADLKELFDTKGFVEGSVSRPGQFVYEKAFVE
jgi:ferredoxin/flavodoxin---NADP+ reductase